MFAPLGANILVLGEFCRVPSSPVQAPSVSFAVLGCWLKRDITYYSAESMRASGNYEGVYE